MTLHNLKFVREHYSACVMYFIPSNIDAYAQNTIDGSEESFDIIELKSLSKEEVSEKNLLSLLSFTQEPISMKDYCISDVLKKHIIENNYDSNDLSLLIAGFERESFEIKKVLHQLFVREMPEILAGEITIPYSLLDLLLRLPSCPNKKELLAIQLGGLTREQAIVCFNTLQMAPLLSVFAGKWPSIEINDVNTSLLKAMEAKRWISSFSQYDEKPDYYRVRARRSKEK